MQCAAHGHEAVVVVAGGLLVLVGGSAPDAEPAAAQVARLGEALAGLLSAILAARVCVGVGEGAHPQRQVAESRRAAAWRCGHCCPATDSAPSRGWARSPRHWR
ncbi:hypothetical protein QF032_000935 [Streptomyces achromogenes]|uniref:Uncharacterized protein n=1 Tax=Streptomyces achromogenes TaxID=67255 RepID=A0ABU0PU84_STRAH|nr:hypothetical protein [Streptomyces achromogenes]MDQ0829091.1 hypothetical protein [Streptomyces achromogenes]